MCIRDRHVGTCNKHTLNRKLWPFKVIVGDQLTCKNIWGAKHWRLPEITPEITPENTLSWVKEIPGTKAIIVIVH